MLKQTLLLLIVLCSISIFSETIYDVFTKDGKTTSGYILEDKPGEVMVLEIESGEIVVLSYDNIIVVKPKKTTVQEPVIIPEITVPDISIYKTDFNIIGPEIEIDIAVKEIRGLSLSALKSVDSTKFGGFSPVVKLDIYNIVKKDDTMKYTLLNIVPGLGSILQKDYYAGLYTLTSVLGGVLYNLAGSGTGTDYYFIANLNGVVAYVSGFFAPLRYNQNYNRSVKDKLSL